MSFSQKAKELREFSGLSQMELSKKIGISAAAIGFLETHTNEPKGATVAAYAKFFDVSADYLLGLEGEQGARVVAPMGESLTVSERELLDRFRKLSPYLQGLALDTVRTWSGSVGGNGLHKKA